MESSWHTCLKSIEINGLAKDQPVVGGIKMISGGFFAPWLAG